MMKNRIKEIISVIFYIGSLLPILAVRSHHNCLHDECFEILYKGHFGACVEKAIDDMYMAMGIMWFVICIGSLVVWSADKNALSPFVIMGLLILLSICGAFVDPAKWMFVVALMPALITLILAKVIDERK